MKKVYVFIIVSLLALTLIACGNEEPKEPKETVSQQGDSRFKQYAIDSLIEEENVNLQPTGAYVEYEILPLDTSGVYSYFEGIEKHHYVYMLVVLKNLSPKEWRVDEGYAQIVFDNKYEYTAQIYASDADLNSWRPYEILSPLEERVICIFASVPDEMIDMFSDASFKIGLRTVINDNSSMFVTSFDDCDNLFQVNVKRDEFQGVIETSNTDTESIKQNPEERFLLAKEYISNQQYIEACEALRGIERTDEMESYLNYCIGMLYMDNMRYSEALIALKEANGILDTDENIKELENIISPYVGVYKGEVAKYKGVYAYFIVNENGQVCQEMASSVDLSEPQYYSKALCGYMLQDGSGKTGMGLGYTKSYVSFFDSTTQYEDLDYWFMKQGDDLIMINIDSFDTFNGSYTKTNDRIPASK